MSKTPNGSGTSSSLVVQTIIHPAYPDQRVPFFRDWTTACKHLCDHLLTAPECDAWAVVEPAYHEILDPCDENARWEYARAAWASQGCAAQRLYDVYCAAAGRDAEDAACLGWHRVEGDLTASMGTSGVLLLLNKTVWTAFLPGQGDPQATRESRQREDEPVLSREQGMRRGRPGRTDEGWRRRQREARAQREAGWMRDQKVYYLAFKPAVQFVKRCHHRCRDMFGRETRGDYALLKSRLPPLSQLKYEPWRTLRQTCGRSD